MKKKKIIKKLKKYLKNNSLVRIKRKKMKDNRNRIVYGYVKYVSDEFVITSFVLDFYDEGFFIMRTKDIKKVSADKRFFAKMCAAEGLSKTECELKIGEDFDRSELIRQLQNMNGFVTVECENEDAGFYIGKIIAEVPEGIVFRNFDVNGVWDKGDDEISYERLTSMHFGDKYARTFYKYIKEKTPSSESALS